MKENSERYAISGINGFLGSSLAEKLTNSGNETIAVGRNSQWPEAEHYIDFAAYGNLYEQNNPVETYRANVFRLVTSLANLSEAEFDSFIVTSSLSVKLKEKTMYSQSKLAAEGVAQQFAKDYDKPIVVVRPSSIYGPGEQPSHLIPKLIDSCLNGTEIPFVADPVHDFLYIDDFVNAIQIVSENAKFYKGHIFEIGSGHEVSNDIVKLTVEEVTGRKANIRQVANMRSYDAPHWEANILDISTLGWKPKHTLYEGIIKTVRSFT